MTQPNKPAALDAIAFLYRNGRSAVIPSPLSDKPNRADTLFKAGDGWTETPLTDLTKAQKRIDRLGARVAKLESAASDALTFTCLVLAFIGRDQGTPRIDKTLDGLCGEARKIETAIRAALGDKQ